MGGLNAPLGVEDIAGSSVNRMVAGSNPARGANYIKGLEAFSDAAIDAANVRGML